MAGPTRGRVRAAAVVLVVAAAALAGCGGGASPAPTASSDEATTEPTTSATTAGETPTPGPTDWPKPERPDAMARDDVAGAKAAAQYFIEMYPYVYATGDLDEWKAMSHEECVFCESVAENVEKMRAEGGHAVGPEVEVTEIVGGDPIEGNINFRIDMTVLQGPAVEYASDGSIVREDDGGSDRLLLALERSAEEWIVRAVQVEPGGTDDAA